MASPVIPNTNLQAAALIRASEHNANWAGFISWASGNIQQDNFGTMAGAINWSISANVLAQSITNTGTEGSVSIAHNGVLAAGKRGLSLASTVAQTLGDALLYLSMSHASSSIPGCYISYAGAANSSVALKVEKTGAGSGALTFQVVSTVAPAIPAPVMTTAQRNALVSPATGAKIYNSSLKRSEDYDGSAWGRSGAHKTIASKTANYTATLGDDVILCDATGGVFTITLPAAASSTGLCLKIKKTDSSANAITIDGNAAETIDGATTASLSLRYQWIEIACDGSNWHIVAQGGGPVGRQLSDSSGAFSTQATSFTDVTNLSISLTTTGRPVMIACVGDGTANPAAFGVDRATAGVSLQAIIRILRDATEIGRHFIGLQGDASTANWIKWVPASSVFAQDTPAAGTYTYKVQVMSNEGVGELNVIAQYIKLLAYEI
jgi:hypothetical protein